jgi:hypothetical protein
MKKRISVLILGGCLALSPAFAAKSKAPKIHPAKSAKVQKNHLKKGQVKVHKEARKAARKEVKSRAKVRRHKSA